MFHLAFLIFFSEKQLISSCQDQIYAVVERTLSTDMSKDSAFQDPVEECVRYYPWQVSAMSLQSGFALAFVTIMSFIFMSLLNICPHGTGSNPVTV